jgi:hypothetical protein
MYEPARGTLHATPALLVASSLSVTSPVAVARIACTGESLPCALVM